MIMTGQMPYEDIPKLIASADICLLPAYNNEIMRDIVPIKIYEYLAMHKLVIATELPGLKKEFGEDNGVVYVPNSDDAVNKILELNDNDLNSIKSKAELFIKDYDWKYIISNFEDLIFEILGSKR